LRDEVSQRYSDAEPMAERAKDGFIDGARERLSMGTWVGWIVVARWRQSLPTAFGPFPDCEDADAWASYVLGGCDTSAGWDTVVMRAPSAGDIAKARRAAASQPTAAEAAQGVRLTR